MGGEQIQTKVKCVKTAIGLLPGAKNHKKLVGKGLAKNTATTEERPQVLYLKLKPSFMITLRLLYLE